MGEAAPRKEAADLLATSRVAAQLAPIRAQPRACRGPFARHPPAMPARGAAPPPAAAAARREEPGAAGGAPASGASRGRNKRPVAWHQTPAGAALLGEITDWALRSPVFADTSLAEAAALLGGAAFARERPAAAAALRDLGLLRGRCARLRAWHEGATFAVESARSAERIYAAVLEKHAASDAAWFAAKEAARGEAETEEEAARGRARRAGLLRSALPVLRAQAHAHHPLGLWRAARARAAARRGAAAAADTAVAVAALALAADGAAGGAGAGAGAPVPPPRAGD